MLIAVKNEINIFIIIFVTLILAIALSVSFPAKYVSVVSKNVCKIFSMMIGNARDKIVMISVFHIRFINKSPIKSFYLSLF